MEIEANKRKYMEEPLLGSAIIVISVFRRFNGYTMFVIFDVIERDLCKLILLETIVDVLC